MIKLKFEELRFILETLPLSAEQEKQIRMVTADLKIELPDELADSLRDSCTERLDTHGFDKDYLPTPEGRVLEDLIDKLFIG